MTDNERKAIADRLRQIIVDAEAAAQKSTDSRFWEPGCLGCRRSWQLGNLESKIRWLAHDIKRGEFLKKEEVNQDGTLGCP